MGVFRFYRLANLEILVWIREKFNEKEKLFVVWISSDKKQSAWSLLL
jgi:hypothetical protein